MELKRLRMRAGLTQTEAAKRMGVPASTWSRWESGERTPSMKQVPKIVKALDCTLFDIFGEEVRT